MPTTCWSRCCCAMPLPWRCGAFGTPKPAGVTWSSFVNCCPQCCHPRPGFMLPLQTLPLFLNKLVHEGVAIIISVTAVLLFGELMGVGKALGTVKHNAPAATTTRHSWPGLSTQPYLSHCHHARRRNHSPGSVLQVWSADRVSHGLACACAHAHHVAHLLASV